MSTFLLILSSEMCELPSSSNASGADGLPPEHFAVLLSAYGHSGRRWLWMVIIGAALLVTSSMDGSTMCCAEYCGRALLGGTYITDGDSSGVHCSLGYEYLAKGDPEGAKTEFEKALRFDRTLASAYNGLGLCLRQGERTTQLAIEHFQKGVALNPDYVEAHYNLGKTYYEYEEDTLARRAFRRAIDIDPDYRDACFYLGMIEKRGAVQYRSILKRNRANKAIVWFDKQIEYDPRHGESYLECGDLYYLLDDIPEAITYFQALKEAQEAPLWADLFLGWCHYCLGQCERAVRHFALAFALMSDDERKLYTEPLMLLSEEEERDYAALPEHRRGDFWKTYWKMRDPTPTTDINERLLEHHFRVSYSRRYFSEGQYPWDDRGEMYVRYGEPDFRSPNFSMYPTGVYERLETLSNVSPAVSHDGTQTYAPAFKPTETWVYFDLVRPLGTQVAFMDEYLTGRYDIPFGVGERQPGIQAQMAIGEVPDVYEHDYGAEPLDFPFDIAAFRGGSGRSALEIYYGIPFGEVRSLLSEGQDEPAIETSVAVFDEDWHTIGSGTKELVFTEEISEAESGNLAVDLFRMEFLPGLYHFAIQVKDAESSRIGIYKKEITVDDYTSSDLMTSDLQLADFISPATEKGKFVKQGLQVIPHPGRQYSIEQPVYVYFEVYNLTKDGYGRTHFRTDYTLSSLKGTKDVFSRVVAEVGEMVGVESKRGEVTISYEDKGTIETEVGYTGIDMRGSPQGTYRLAVAVTDLNSGEKREKNIDFTLQK